MKDTRKYWLLGGIASTVLLSVLAFVDGIGGLDGEAFSSPFVKNVHYLMTHLNAPLNFIPEVFATGWAANLAFLAYRGYHFLIGAILGWIYGKVKNRNKV